MRTKKLEPVDKNAWERSVKDHNKDYTIIERLCEILGSMDNATKVNINILNDEIIVYHNGDPIDSNDMKRLLDVYTHIFNENKKGTSEQGIGWRAVATTSSLSNIKEYNNDYTNYSIMVSKINQDISVSYKEENINYNKDEVISIVYDNDFSCSYISENDTDIYKKLFEKHLSNEHGVLFRIPNNKEFDIDLITHQLRLLFNRFEGELFLNNKEISNSKPCYYIDKMHGNHYLDASFELFTYHKEKVLSMTINDKTNIDRLNENTIYLNMKTYRRNEEIYKLETMDDWLFTGDINSLVADNYSFSIRAMAIDPDTHGSEDFKKWHNYYTHGAGKHIGDGIIPYINNNCLRFNLDDKKKGYLKKKGVSKKSLEKNGGGLIPINSKKRDHTYNYNYKNNIHRVWGKGKSTLDHTEQPVILSAANKYIRYKPNQNYLCELIETGSSNEHSIINRLAKKSESTCTEGRGWKQTFPFFITFLIFEYVWFRDKEEDILTEDDIERAEKAEKEAKKAIKEKELAEQKARQAEKDKKLAEKKAQQAEKDKKLAEKKAEEAKKDEQKAKEKELVAIHDKENERSKKLKAQHANNKLAEVLQEQREIKEEFEKEVEKEYIPINDEKNIDEGYCYCLIDKTREKWRKIGQTRKDKDELLNQYNRGKRYFPIPLVYVHWCDYKSSKLAEKNIFNKLVQYKYEDTEWFHFKDMKDDEINKLIEEEFVKVKSFMD